MSEQIVSALLRETVGQRSGAAKLSPTTLLLEPPSPSTPTPTLQLVQPLDDFLALASQHTARLPPVLCARPAATPAESAFSVNVLEPVRIAAHVLAAVGLLDAAYAMVNPEPGQLLYCEGAAEQPKMFLLACSPIPTAEAVGARFWTQIVERCRHYNVRHFGVTDYERWAFGCLSAGCGNAWLSPPIAVSSTQPTVREALCYWMAQSRKTPTEEALPSPEPPLASQPQCTATTVATIEETPPAPLPASLLRRPSSSAAIRPPDPDENAKPSTPRRRKAAVVAEDESTMTVSPRKRKAATTSAEDAELASPRKRRVAAAGDEDAEPASPRKRRAGEDDAEMVMQTPSRKRKPEDAEDGGMLPPTTPTPSPKKRRVVVVDDLPAARRVSPRKVPLPDSPSPRKLRVPALPSHMQLEGAADSEQPAASSSSARPHAFVTPPTSARPSTPPAAPAPYSSHSPAKNYAASRESPSPRRRGRRNADDDDDDAFWLPEIEASPRKRKAAADDVELEASPRKRRAGEQAGDAGDGSPRKRRAAAAVVDEPRTRRGGLRTRTRSKGE